MFFKVGHREGAPGDFAYRDPSKIEKSLFKKKKKINDLKLLLSDSILIV